MVNFLDRACCPWVRAGTPPYSFCPICSEKHHTLDFLFKAKFKNRLYRVVLYRIVSYRIVSFLYLIRIQKLLTNTRIQFRLYSNLDPGCCCIRIQTKFTYK
jgi:hypothetical protein